jgi:rhomboid protease GluP
VRDGEWWRLASAAFLHFDLKHLIGNMSALLFLGPPLAAQIGHLRTFVLFLASAVAGNVVSQILGNDAAVKAGASGGICGLLGALAGVALARMAAAEDARARRPAWQTLGALVALFGMIVGFEPGRDHYAHVGGLIAGLLLGRAFGVGRTEA